MKFSVKLISVTLLLTSFATLASSPVWAVDLGPLDQPLPVTGNQIPGKPGAVSLQAQAVTLTTDPVTAQAELRIEVAEEQRELELLPREELQDRAESGERAAQVVLGADFAHEATLLSFAPEAANDALSDAARWYSLAASRGFPGAPSLDQSGVRFYPIRIQRALR